MARKKNSTNTLDILPDKPLPHSMPAEISLLGSMLLSREAIGEVIPLLKEEAFFNPSHRLIFRALIRLYTSNQPPDPVILCRELERMGVLDQVGGPQYIAKLMTAVSSPANATYYAKTVRELYLLRQLIQNCFEIIEEAYSDAYETENILDRAEQKIFAITEDRITSGPEQLKKFLEKTFEALSEREGFITGIPTGFVEIDDLTCGLQNGELIIIAGRPSMGKTAFGMNIAEHMAVEERKPVAFFSLEMSKQQLVQRLLCSRAKVDSHRLRKNLLSSEDISRLHLACDVLQDAPLFIDDSPGMTILELRAKARLLKAKENINAVFVDYLQLLSCPGAESRQIEISLISQGLKALARELNIPVIALAQLNRGVEGRENKRPRMSDLRESGSIEQEADLIMLLHREDYYRETGQELEGEGENDSIAEVIIAKQRNGPVGTVKLLFSKKFTRFENLAARHIEDVPPYIHTDESQVPF